MRACCPANESEGGWYLRELAPGDEGAKGGRAHHADECAQPHKAPHRVLAPARTQRLASALLLGKLSPYADVADCCRAAASTSCNKSQVRSLPFAAVVTCSDIPCNLY